MAMDFNINKAPAPVADINVTPMVDVMLVLLIIFMVITPMLTHGVSVDMVKTHNPVPMQAADKSDAVLIAVTRDGNVFLNNRLDKECFVRADQRAKYQTVLDVVQNLQSAGVDQLGLLTDQIEAKKQPAAAAM